MLSAATINTKNGPSAIGAATIVFRGSDDGDEQVADGFACSGSLTGWLAAANRAIVHPIPFVIMHYFRKNRVFLRYFGIIKL